MQHSQAKTPAYSRHNQICSEESPGLSGEEKPRRQEFAASSVGMLFLEVCPERGVSLLGEFDAEHHAVMGEGLKNVSKLSGFFSKMNS